jgi:hypothetical protein
MPLVVRGGRFVGLTPYKSGVRIVGTLTGALAPSPTRTARHTDMKNMRVVIMGLGAGILYFVVSILVGGLLFALGMWVNRNATGLNALVAPFYVRVLAAVMGIFTGLFVLERVFRNYPKKMVAVIIFTVFGVLLLIEIFPTLALIFMICLTIATNLHSSELWTTIPPAAVFWKAFIDGLDDNILPFLTYAAISSVMAWRFLWLGRPI